MNQANVHTDSLFLLDERTLFFALLNYSPLLQQKQKKNRAYFNKTKFLLSFKLNSSCQR